MNYEHLEEVKRYRELKEIEKLTQDKLKELSPKLVEAVCKFKQGQEVKWMTPPRPLKNPFDVIITDRSVSSQTLAPCYKIRKKKSNSNHYYSWVPESEFQEIML